MSRLAKAAQVETEKNKTNPVDVSGKSVIVPNVLHPALREQAAESL